MVLVDRLRRNWFRILVHLGALVPLALLLYDTLMDRFLVDLVAVATARTGQTALILLVLSLSCTPLYILFGLRQVLQVRRALGLYALLYAGLHFFVFLWLDYALDWPLIWQAIIDQRFVVVGFVSLVILVALGITSTVGWKRRLGKGWKRLHSTVYLAGILAVLHFMWLVKDIREPLIYAAVLGFLLGLRVPPVKRWVIRTRRRLGSAWREGRAPSGKRSDGHAGLA